LSSGLISTKKSSAQLIVELREGMKEKSILFSSITDKKKEWMWKAINCDERNEIYKRRKEM